LRPAARTSRTFDFWLQRTPKKLRERIPEQLAVVGWGVYIGRRRNWHVWQVLSKLLIVLSLLFGVVYKSLKRDASSSFAVAQYAVAAMMMLLKVAELLQQQCCQRTVVPMLCPCFVCSTFGPG
jgi:hypothetical protein